MVSIIGYTKSKIDSLLSVLVPGTRQVNGHALSSDLSLTQDDIGDGTTYIRMTAAEKTAVDSLGTASTHATGDFATAAQGTKADNALPHSTTIVAGQSGFGWLLHLINNYSPSGTDPEPIFVETLRSAALQRAFWLNESGSPRGASVQDEAALKLFGPNANTAYTGDVLALIKAYDTQTYLWGINALGQMMLGASKTIGGGVVVINHGASVPSDLPPGTVIFEKTS